MPSPARRWPAIALLALVGSMPVASGLACTGERELAAPPPPPVVPPELQGALKPVTDASSSGATAHGLDTTGNGLELPAHVGEAPSPSTTPDGADAGSDEAAAPDAGADTVPPPPDDSPPPADADDAAPAADPEPTP